ncbi:Helix-turn-helix trascriptional regulator [Rickettsiales endosymbiont of Paramecium tredecaurelia]|uniref:helix-turn-helix domain-containing protein n=1 Tax=Candidatus Sarmatiella mevalonica TaxID=2770581 RepID=UPI001921AF3D|nr:helix-turn-helix domain-containing protein [Candidatus Sarmatiella mevalonica]MBL3284945.1 Helix-turn-helix trascriptional regulator [Candidatus Sarmatiella mevalonica]
MSNNSQEYASDYEFDFETEDKKEKRIRAGGKGKASSIDELISRRVKTLRLMSGLNQEKLGEALGVSTQQVQKYEKGTNRISSGRLFYIAQILNVPVSYFFEEIDRGISYGMQDFNLDSRVAEEEEGFLAHAISDDASDSDARASDKEVIECVRTFSSIPSRRIRKKLLDLMRSMVRDTENAT